MVRPPLRFEKKRVLITGMTGFIGSHLTRAFLREGAEVHGISRHPSRFRDLESKNLLVHTYDRTYESLASTIQEIQPEICIHLASLFIAQHQPEQIDALVESNLRFGLHLAEALAQMKRPDQIMPFINTGTAWQHAKSKIPSSPYSPVSLYAATKQAYEDLLQYYFLHRNFSVIHLKLFDSYGPNDPRGKLISILLERGKSQVPLEMTEGEQLIDLVYIDDVIEAFLRAAELTLMEKKWASYSVSSGVQTSLRNLVGLLERATGLSIPVLWGAKPYRPIEMFEPWNAGPPLPGWSPKISFEEGVLRITAGSFENNHRGQNDHATLENPLGDDPAP